MVRIKCHSRYYMDKTLPRYTHEKLLGEGGMGKVYLATDNKLERKVAIKELTSLTKKQAQAERVDHVLKEGRILARVNHSNIIQIYDLYNIDDEDNHIALVMEYFKSKTLTQFQNETITTLVQKLDLLRQLAAGLAQAHKNDVIHCDLKPNNILVNDQGLLKITDFGIACLIPSIATSETNSYAQNKTTTPSEPLKRIEASNYGCLFFMSPEQIKQQTVDYRTDIFSLGIIAYQLIVGSHPFTNINNKGSTSEVANRICEQPAEHAKNLMVDAPNALTDLLMEMLIKPVEHRTLTASVIENRLKHIRDALIQADMNEQATLLLSNSEFNTEPHTGVQTELNNAIGILDKISVNSKNKLATFISSICFLCLIVILSFWLYSPQDLEIKQVVILKPTLTNSPLMAPMQQDLVISAIEDALRQSVINTKNMYLISQREVNAITKEYPDDLKKLKQAVGASDIISTALECDNSRCKVSFSRLINSENSSQSNSEVLAVKSENNWLTSIDKFNAIYSTSQTKFASLYPELSEVNQSGLVQRPINEDDYRSYIKLYSQIKGQRKYSDESLSKLEAILTRSPYLYAAYSLYRDNALDLYWDSKDKKYFNQLDSLLQSSPPEYRYSAYEAIDRFLLASDMENPELAQQQISEAQQRGADDLIIFELKGYMYFSLGQYQKAVDSYSNAFKLRPSTTLLNNIAYSYWRLGDLKKAETVLSQMLNIVPNNYQGQRLQANIWLLQGQLDLAITAYEKIVSKLNNSKDLTNLSLAYALNKQYKKSLEYAKLSVNQTPNNTINLLNLADIELILGNEKSALNHYKKIVNAAGDISKYRYWLDLAQAYLQLSQNDLAMEALNHGKKLAPNNGEVAYTSALVYSVLGEKTSAVFEVKKALSTKVGAVWFNLPWFDNLCEEKQFQQLMSKYDNTLRCSTLIKAE